MASQEFLSILMPCAFPDKWIASMRSAVPHIRIEKREIDRNATELPTDISPGTWRDVTALFTWKLLPPKELVPSLQYVQLLSAGCNHVMGTSLFAETDVAFCTANGVHPWVLSQKYRERRNSTDGSDLKSQNGFS